MLLQLASLRDDEETHKYSLKEQKINIKRFGKLACIKPNLYLELIFIEKRLHDALQAMDRK